MLLVLQITRDDEMSWSCDLTLVGAYGVCSAKGSKVIKGSFSNVKNNSVNVFYMNKYVKVSTVTPSSDLSLRGQRSKPVKISKYFKWQK